MPQNKSYAKIVTLGESSMQVTQQFKVPSQQHYLDSNIRNLKLQSQLFQIDSILNRLKIREIYLVNQLVYTVKNNLPSGTIYAKELQQVRALTTKISNINQQMKNFYISVAASKHAWRLNS